MGVLDHLRVLQAGSTPALRLVGTTLSDFGAAVVALMPGVPDQPNLHRGRSTLSLARGDVPWMRVVAGYDVVLFDDEHAAQGEMLIDQFPELIIGCLTSWGRGGVYERYPLDEDFVHAKVGRMMQFQRIPNRLGPVYSAVRVAAHAASQSLLSGILAALHARDLDGRGELIETSLLRGLLPYDLAGLHLRQAAERRQRTGEPEPLIDPETLPERIMPTLNYHPLQTRDGQWLQVGNLLPHLFMNFVRAVGLFEKWQEMGLNDSPATWTAAAREEFRDAMFSRMQTKTAAEWQSIFVADGGIASHPYQTAEAALGDADIVANGHSSNAAQTIQLGVLASLTETPGRVAVEHAEALRASNSVVKARTAPPSLPLQRPLEGITVVEAATIIAAPLGASFLADLGARVIKFEPIDGDPFRGMLNGFGAARCNTGKESIALDLKKPQAQAIAQAILAKVDVLIHNYRPGVPERLGIGYEQLKAINPRLIYVSANGYGPKGPGALRPSTHPIPGAAMGGVLRQLGGALPTELMTIAELREASRRLMRANELNPDPNTSVVVCSASLLALLARQRTGVGQAVFVDMFGANAWANFDDFFWHPKKQATALPDRQGFGLNPIWRLYRCESGWVFFGVRTESEWRVFCAAVQMHLDSAGLELPATINAARSAGERIVGPLQTLFAQASASFWEGVLAPLSIGCVRADERLPSDFFRDDEHAKTQSLVIPTQHAEWGDCLRHGTQLQIKKRTLRLDGACTKGDATEKILSELGHSEDAIARFRRDGVVA